MKDLSNAFAISIVVGIMSTAVLTGCTSQKDANRALEAEGYTKIQGTGYNLFACSQDDFFHTGFRATNTQGKVIEGTVCSGLLFKNATIRY